jgi:hypothetical protein
MVTKTFICDKCQKSVDEVDLFKVDISIRNSQQAKYLPALASCIKDICRGCLVENGIIFEHFNEIKKNAERNSENQKTLESKITNFLVDLGVVFEKQKEGK